MKLYTKQLNSIDELKREKQRLKKELKEKEQKGFFSLSDVLPGNDAPGKGDGIINKAAGMLGGSGITGLLMNIGGPLLSMATGKAKNKILKTVAKEFLGGYVKWKAVELGYRAVKMAVNKAKKKAEDKAK